MWARALLAWAALCAGARAWPGGAVCARRAGAGGARYVAFLSGGGGGLGGGASALVESAWGARGRLRACWARRDPRLARAFRAACARRPPAATAAAGAALRRDLAALWRRRAACSEPAPPPARRRRRGWTLPGTLWCGAGDSAGNAGELGLFRGPDRCCREHDQCSVQIAALQFGYGIRNYRPHTVSHCDCDARFRQCLLALNDTVSDVIGVTFFNLLEVPCFVLEESEECVQRRWWGRCERYAVVPRARMVRQSRYRDSPPAEEPGGPAGQPPGEGRKAPRAGRKRLREGAGRSSGPRRARRPAAARQPRRPGPSPPGSAGVRAEPAAGRAAAQRGPQPPAPTAPPALEPDTARGRRAPAGARRGAAEGRRRRQGRGRACRSYKALDKCEHRIPPGEVKYELHNAGTRTLFHCNCTRRLGRYLGRANDLKAVEVAMLADRVAVDCFVLELPTECSLDEGSQHNCITETRAVLVPARPLKEILRRWGPSHVTSKAKPPDWKTQDSGGTLYERCLQLAVEQKLGAQPHTLPR